MSEVDKLVASVEETALWHEILVLNSPESPSKKRRNIMALRAMGKLTDLQAELLLEAV